tara:strand:+ start:305 stop:577 length:273 start_codon:yes stop_codon:yes gene_type:complete
LFWIEEYHSTKIHYVSSRLAKLVVFQRTSNSGKQALRGNKTEGLHLNLQWAILGLFVESLMGAMGVQTYDFITHYNSNAGKYLGRIIDLL